MSDKNPTSVIPKIFDYFKRSFAITKDAKKYLQSQGFDLEELKKNGIEIGYNSAQFHHRENAHLIPQCLEENILLKNPSGGYKVWGKNGIVFPLKNSDNEIVNLYSIKFDNENENRVDIFLNQEGFFPAHPNSETKKIIVVSTIFDACVLIQNKNVNENFSVLVLDEYLCTDNFLSALKNLDNLSEIILLNVNSEILVEELKEEIPLAEITFINLPDGEKTLLGILKTKPEIIFYLIERRTSFLDKNLAGLNSELDVSIIHQIKFSTVVANYFILGGVQKEFNSMKITLMVENKSTKKKSRKKIDLYEDSQIEKTSLEISERLLLRSDLIETDLLKLTDLLEAHRNSLFDVQEEEVVKVVLSAEEIKECEALLKQPDLLVKINSLIGDGGIVGEETNRLFLFIIASSYKMPEPLNALIQGSSGSGKTHLMSMILSFIPQEDVITMTRVSEKSFYNFDENYLDKKILGLEDLDGLGEEAEFALRELMTKGMLTSSISFKDTDGSIRSKVKTVRASLSSISCTTKGEIYEDNMNRNFLIAMDESKEQSEKIVEHQNRKSAGKLNKAKQEQAQKFIQNCIRVLESVDVINPYAEKVLLPKEVHKVRRLNQMYQSFVKQIAILYQYQRTRDEYGRVVAEKQDLILACDLMFESILLKIDELDGSLRHFYEQLKDYIAEQTKPKTEPSEPIEQPAYSFTQLEIRQRLNYSKSQLQRYINDLLDLEYICISKFNLKGYRYKILYWDDAEKLKAKTRLHLTEQLNVL